MSIERKGIPVGPAFDWFYFVDVRRPGAPNERSQQRIAQEEQVRQPLGRTTVASEAEITN